MLKIENLKVCIEKKNILNGLNLEIERGKIHAIMGPNGAGKSTLAKILAGHPLYEVEEGTITFKGQNLLEMEPEERSHLGLFMSFQYPIEIPGVTNFQFLLEIKNAQRKSLQKPVFSEEEFSQFLDEKMEKMDVKKEFKHRNLNENFSGGEKKQNEILQMAILEPDLAILDETDSGLDIDAMKKIAKAVQTIKGPEQSLILITHYQRLLDYIRPDFVHVMMEGKIVQSGNAELALELEEKGYDWLK